MLETKCGLGCVPLPHNARVPAQVLVTRGGCPLLEKAVRIHQAGGLAIVVADTGKCDLQFDQRCCAGSSKLNGEGWAFADTGERWRQLHMPAIMIKQNNAAELELFFD